MNTRARSTTLVVATLSILLASCAGSGDESEDVSSLASAAPSETETIGDVVATGAPRPADRAMAVTVSDQTSDGATVTVDEVVADDTRAFVVIHADESGAPGDVLGHAEVPYEGPTTDLTVTLDQPLDGSSTLWAMIHLDVDPTGIYEFPGGDVPATVDGTVVMAPFEVTVEG